MVELNATDAFAGALPMTYGTVTVAALDLGAMTSLSPFGDASDLSGALEKAHGVTLPGPGESTVAGDVRCIWFGRGEVLLTGVPPSAELARHAAVVDQSDGWAVVSVEGADAVDVLARLVPLDLRDKAFPLGATARSQVLHMHGSITKRAADSFMIMVFRSMAGTLVHDLKQAMAAVASRR